MDKDGHLELAVLDVNGGDHMDIGVSSCSSSPALRALQGDTAMFPRPTHQKLRS